MVVVTAVLSLYYGVLLGLGSSINGYLDGLERLLLPSGEKYCSFNTSTKPQREYFLFSQVVSAANGSPLRARSENLHMF